VGGWLGAERRLILRRSDRKLWRARYDDCLAPAKRTLPRSAIRKAAAAENSKGGEVLPQSRTADETVAVGSAARSRPQTTQPSQIAYPGSSAREQILSLQAFVT
jgi:hypothetical protein